MNACKQPTMGCASVDSRETLLKVRARTECLINTRDRSVKELKDRLSLAGFASSVVEQEVERAVNAGLVDDERFTRLFIAGKKHCGWGRMKIEYGLYRYGIDLRGEPGYPDDFFDEEGELKRAMDYVANHRLRAKDIRAAFYRRLRSRGFSADVIQKVLKMLTI